MTIMIYANSTTVMDVLQYSWAKGVKFSVIVCETRPRNEGIEFAQTLSNLGISVKLITDNCMAYALEKTDIVLVGAESVVENGGIINRVGTYTLALCASVLKKPFYVLAESILIIELNF